MFDVSFSELMIIAVVALLVIGPDKLPQVARTVGALVGRLQRYVAQVKEEVSREVRFEELQRLQQEIKRGANQVEAGMLDSARAMQEAASVNQVAKTKPNPASKKTVTKRKPALRRDPSQSVLDKASPKRKAGDA